MHEVTHAIETNSMKELVLDYASKNQEFNQALESLKKTYETEDVSSEVLADISGQLFGNQEFINNLSMEKPNIFKKIYNSIVSLANKITGNSKESLFIKDLKNKWEEAYRNNSTDQSISNLNNETKYSTIGLRRAKNLENNSTDRYYKNLYKGQKNAELIHNSSDKDLETTNVKSKKETGWFKTKYNDWGTLISDKDSKIIKKLETNKSYKLGEILEHDLLYKAYPELKKLKVITTDIKPTANIAKYKNLPANEYTTEIYLKNDDLNKKDFRNTLLHEINHYIEMREHYDKNSIGSNTNIDSKEDYENNLGEIISNETKIYSDFTQQKLDDIILPEQAKNNPKYENIKEELKKVNKKDRYIEGENENVTQTNRDLSQNKFKDNSLVNNESNNNSRIKDYYGDEELDNSSFSLLKNSDGKQIDISNLKENSTMERFHYNRKYDKNNVIAYRGESENTGTNPAFYGLGLYTTLDSKYAKQYGNVSIIDNNLLPDNPLKFKTQNDFNIWDFGNAIIEGFLAGVCIGALFGIVSFYAMAIPIVYPALASVFKVLSIASGIVGTFISLCQGIVELKNHNYFTAVAFLCLGMISLLALAAGLCSASNYGATESSSSTSFYTVQSEADEFRLLNGGTPWPTEDSRAALGEGVYAWETRAEAEKYLQSIIKRDPSARIVEFSVNLDNLKSLNIDALPQDQIDIFMMRYSRLYGGTPNHGYDHLQRGTNYGVEHYFSYLIYELLNFK